mmetsp:Transcript_31718/g.64546  ORF Transcript_31718/g.64546 Transcript_31718/m.64546 type:complete len:474 (+) Transcript_31718:56-1477(+)
MSTEAARHGGGSETSAASASSGGPRDVPQAPDSLLGKKRKASDTGDSVDTSSGAAVAGVRKSKKMTWTVDEDQELLEAIHEARKAREDEKGSDNEDHKDNEGEDTDGDDDDDDWDEIAKAVPGRTAVQCLQRYMKHLAKKRKVSFSPGSKEGDQKTAYVGDQDATKGTTKVVLATWSVDDVTKLKRLVEQYAGASPDWSSIASNFPNWTAINCLSKWKELSKASNTKGKGSWSAEEDAILREKRALYGRKWSKIASFLPGRQGKQCRERYINHLDPLLKKGEWTDDEEAILIACHQRHGNRWAIIAKELPGRSDNDVKNHWYSTIQRKFHMHGKDKLVSAAIKQVQILMKERAEAAPAAPPAVAYSHVAQPYTHSQPQRAPHPFAHFPAAYGHIPPVPPPGYTRPLLGYGYTPYPYPMPPTAVTARGQVMTGSAQSQLLGGTPLSPEETKAKSTEDKKDASGESPSSQGGRMM